MTNKRCSAYVLQTIVSLAFVAASPCMFGTRVRSQETTPKGRLHATTLENVSVPSTPRSLVNAPPELCLLGIWSYEATTHVVPAEWSGDVVQRGHWAVTYSEGAYMTAYLFDKGNVTGQKFLLRVFTQNDKMLVERIDVQDSYTKHFGICRVNEDGSTIELAFNNPLDGSAGAVPSSFDPKSEPKGFLTIKLKRLSDRPTGHIEVTGVGSQQPPITQR
jgi:hypothetical protein